MAPQSLSLAGHRASISAAPRPPGARRPSRVVASRPVSSRRPSWAVASRPKPSGEQPVLVRSAGPPLDRCAAHPPHRPSAGGLVLAGQAASATPPAVV